MTIREHHPNAVIPYLMVITKILPCVLVTTLATITFGGVWLNSLAIA